MKASEATRAERLRRRAEKLPKHAAAGLTLNPKHHQTFGDHAEARNGSKSQEPDELDPLRKRMAKGRLKYPKGCTAWSLIDEAGEVAHAINKYESEERVRDELLDVAGVAMRLYHGEIDLESTVVGLRQRRPKKEVFLLKHGKGYYETHVEPHYLTHSQAAALRFASREEARAARKKIGRGRIVRLVPRVPRNPLPAYQSLEKAVRAWLDAEDLDRIKELDALITTLKKTELLTRRFLR